MHFAPDPSRAVRWLVCAALALGACAAWSHHRVLPADRQLAMDSRVLQDTRAIPLPADVRDVLAIALLFDYGHEQHAARQLWNHAEYTALAAITGESLPQGTVTVGSVIDGPARAQANRELRQRALRLVQAEPLTAFDAKVAPDATGWTFRHEGKALWSRTQGGQDIGRQLGVQFHNASALPLFRGEATLWLDPAARSIDLNCNIGAVDAGASAAFLCWTGGRAPELQAVTAALDAIAAGAHRARLDVRKATFRLAGLHFEVRADGANYEHGPGYDVEARAWGFLESQSCGNKGTCTETALRDLKASPFVLGLLAGGALGALFLVLPVAWGGRARRSVLRRLVAVALAGSVLAIVATMVATSGLGWLYGFAIMAAAAGAAGHALFGFMVGAVLAYVAGRVLRGGA